MLQCCDKILQEAAGGCAVHRTVIIGQRKPHRRIRRDLPVHGADALRDAVDTEECDLRRIDDGREALDAKGAEVADGKCA